MKLISPWMFVAACIPLSALASDTQRAAWEAVEFDALESAVNADAIIVEGGTEIRWMPEPFRFTPGDSVRYIDYESGDDTNDGTAKEKPWKHHPWDAEAGDQAAAEKGVHTYVFKGGVTYRGQLTGREAGTDDEPIRLTRDPSWGDGPATLAASVEVDGWQLVDSEEAKLAGIPDGSIGKVWSVTLPGDFIPRAAWLVDEDGKRERIPLARWPNWKIEHPFNHFTQWFRVDAADSERSSRWPRTKIAAEVLKGFEPDAFDGATMWINHVSPGGNIAIIGPFPSDVHRYNPEEGSMMVPLTHPNRYPQIQSPFFLENLPRFLDTDGEWTFVPEGRKLYLRLPSDINPNEAIFEVARHEVTVDLDDVKHVEISGLNFTGGNVPDLNRAARGVEKPGEYYSRPGNFSQMAAIRLTGDVSDIGISHVRIHDSAGSGISNNIEKESDQTADVTISDSELVNIDNDGIYFATSAGPTLPSGKVTGLNILRNRLENIGMRCSADQGGRGINASGLQIGEIAGNVVHQTAAMGINVVGARGPLNRILIHGNQVSEGLMHKNDFGNIEFWGHGPAYIYNNLSIDPVGFFANLGSYHKGEAFYFDHGVKAFLFNNIGWSRNWPEARHGVLGQSFFKEVRNRWNQAFHNTGYNFRIMQAMEGVNGEQQHYLANLFIQRHASTNFFDHWGFKDADGIGYARNVLAGPHSAIFSRDRGFTFRTTADFQKQIDELQNHVSTDVAAWFTPEMPVIDPEARDFRPTDTSAAIDRGVKVFVPWGLYGNVGEWFFRHQPGHPNTVLAYDLYNQPMYAGGAVPENIPFNELIGEGFTSEDYQVGILEDWNRGALRFDGTKFMKIPQEQLVQEIKKGEGDKQVITPGTERRTVRMTDNNFSIEAVLLADQTNEGGIVAGKISDQAGYSLGLDDEGRPVLTLKTGGVFYTVPGEVSLHDGKWHHLFAEVDRAASKVTLYLDGKDITGSSVGTMPQVSASLDNENDFVVGQGFRGALDYLRVSRGTLADAKTNIGELMSWQFNGPQFRDITGRSVVGESRDVGAIEHPEASGRKPIPEAPLVADGNEVDANTRMLTGPWQARLMTQLEAAPLPQRGHNDPGISENALKAVRPEVDDSAWENYDPGKEEMWPGFADVDGEAVFRFRFDVPEEWAGKALELSLGPVDDLDETFWNGTSVGSTTIATPAFWQHARVYTIPAELVSAGPAVIAVRAFDRFGSGGMNSFPEERFVRLADVEGSGDLIVGEDGWLEGSSRNIQTYPWGSISVPQAAKPGDSVTVQISFGVETFQTTPGTINLFAAIQTGSEEPRLIEVGPQPVTQMDPNPYSFTFNFPEVGDAEEVSCVFHVSPDNTWEKKHLSAEATIKVQRQ